MQSRTFPGDSGVTDSVRSGNSSSAYHRGDSRCMGSHADLRCRVQDHGVWGDWSAELEDDGFLDIQLRFRHGGQTALKMLIFSEAC